MSRVLEPPAAVSPASAEVVPLAAPAGERLVSLDVFRGMTIAGMLLVNNPGTWSAIYPPLRHAEWHGWTPTDLIFPFFLFIVGVAMTFSFGRRAARGSARRELLVQAGKRSLILFGLGLVLAGFPSYDLTAIRIPGVLQRIALAYFFATAIVLFTGWRAQARWTLGLLLGYWALETLVPVPGYGAASLEAGKDLGAFIDRVVFGQAHLWQYSRTWDPEGILSTLPAIGTTLVGVLTGHWLRSGRSPTERTAGLFFAGNLLLVAGMVWNWGFPINKNIWTSSYVLFTGGIACNVLAACYWFIDVKGYRRWARPFVVYGTNAIAAYFLSSLVARILAINWKVAGPSGPIPMKQKLFETLYAPWLSPINASLAYALGYVLFWLAIMWLFHRKRIFLKV